MTGKEMTFTHDEIRATMDQLWDEMLKQIHDGVNNIVYGRDGFDIEDADMRTQIFALDRIGMYKRVVLNRLTEDWKDKHGE